MLEAITTASGFRGWWTECDVGTCAGERAVFHFDTADATFVIDRIDRRGIEMTCTSSERLRDWEGTHLSLRARPDGSGTSVELLHDGYPAKNAVFETCAAGWAHYLASLKSFCETGQGIPWDSPRHPRNQPR